MKLTLADKSVLESPEPEAIEAALQQRPRPYGWEVSLDASGKVLSASIVDGEVRLAVDEETEVLGMKAPWKSRVLDPVDEALLCSVFASYAKGDERWRKLCRWSELKSDPGPKPPWTATVLIWLLVVMIVLPFVPATFLPGVIPEALRVKQNLFGLFPLAITWMITSGAAYILDEKLATFRQMTGWTRGRATIQQSDLASEVRIDPNYQGNSVVSRPIETTFYWPVVGYEYTVGSRRYYSTGIGLEADGVSGSNEGIARRVVERYPVASEVPIFYDPKHPSRSALDRGLPDLTGRMGLLIALALVMFALTLALEVVFVQGYL